MCADTEHCRIMVSYIHRVRGAVMRSVDGRSLALEVLETLLDKVTSGEVESVYIMRNLEGIEVDDEEALA